MHYDLHIDGPIGYWITAENVRYRLEALASSKDGGGDGDKPKPLHVRICSPGGSLADGLAICALLRDHGHVHAHIQGMTASAATVLAMGCAHITMTPESVMLIHNASYLLFEWEQANKERLAEKQAEYDALRQNLATLDATMARLYSARTGRPEAEMATLMGEERWLTAQEALDLGLIDEIEAVSDRSSSASASDGEQKAVSDRRLVAAFCAGYGLPSFSSTAQPETSAAQSSEKGSVTPSEKWSATPSMKGAAPPETFWKKLSSLFSSTYHPQNSMTQEEIKALTAERDALKKTKAALETDTEALTKDRDELKAKLDETTTKLTASEEKATALEAKLQEAQAKIKELEQAQASADGAVTTQVDPIAEQPQDDFLAAVAEARKAVALFS